MIFFDTSENQLGRGRSFDLPPLGGQWKIIFDFKPTEYVQEERKRIVMSLVMSYNSRQFMFLELSVRSQKIFLRSYDMMYGRDPVGELKMTIESNELPEVDKWTRVEISHEKEDDKYFLYLTVGGNELGRKEVTSGELRGPAGTLVNIGKSNIENYPISIQPGLVRRLIALGK